MARLDPVDADAQLALKRELAAARSQWPRAGAGDPAETEARG